MAMFGTNGRETPEPGSAWPSKRELASLHARVQGMGSSNGSVRITHGMRGIDFVIPASTINGTSRSQYGYAAVGGVHCGASGYAHAAVVLADGTSTAATPIYIRTPTHNFDFPSDTEVFVWTQASQYNAVWPYNMTGYNTAATLQVYGHQAGAWQWIGTEEFSCPT